MIGFKAQATSDNFNNAFLSKTVDDIKTGKLTLRKVDGDTSQILDVQDYINLIALTTGLTENDVNARVYATENIIANGDNQKQCIEKFDVAVSDNQNNIASIQTVVDDHEARIAVNTGDILAINDSVGQPDGIAPLGPDGLIPANNLPSYVDDILEFPTFGDFPVTGEDGKIYVAEDTHLIYRWSGTAYIQVNPSISNVETFADFGSFPTTGDLDVIYIADDTNVVYRWDDTLYKSLNEGGGLEQYADIASFPVTGRADRIYLNTTTGFIYSWNGSGYSQINRPSVEDYADLASFPVTGQPATIYIDESTNFAYRWDGLTYALIAGGGGGGLEQYADLASFPATGEDDILYVALDTGTTFYWDGSVYISTGVKELTELDDVEITTPIEANQGLYFDSATQKFINRQPYDAFISDIVGDEYENTYSLNVNADGTIAEQSISGSGITVTKTGTGLYLVDFSSLSLKNLAAIDIDWGLNNNINTYINYDNQALDSVRAVCRIGSTLTDLPFSITIEKTGTDHKKTAVVNVFDNADGTFEAIKTSREPNDYVLNVDASGNITEQNFPSSGISVSKTGTGFYLVDYSGLGLTSRPSISVETIQGGSNTSNCFALTNTSVTVNTFTVSGSDADLDFSITISRTNSDYIAANDINFYEGEQALYGAVVSTNLDNSYENTYSLNVSASGAITEQSIANSGISVSKTGTGQYLVDYSSLGLIDIPTALVTTGATTYYNSRQDATATSVLVKVYAGANGALTDLEFSITIEKTGQDHKQQANVNVFTNTSGVVETIKTSRQPNEYALNVDSAGNITEGSIAGSGITVSKLQAGGYLIDYSSLGLNEVPSLNISKADAASASWLTAYNSTTDQSVIENFNSVGTRSDSAFSITITKTGADYNPIEDIQINLGADVYNFPVSPDTVLIEKIENSTFDGSDVFRASFDPNDFANGDVIVPVNAQGKAVKDTVNSGGNYNFSSGKFPFPDASTTSLMYGYINSSGEIEFNTNISTVAGGRAWIEFTYED